MFSEANVALLKNIIEQDLLRAIGETLFMTFLPTIIAFLIGTVYAASDELHQLFVPGRSGELTDTMLDGLGVLLGVLLLSILLNRRRKGRTEA